MDNPYQSPAICAESLASDTRHRLITTASYFLKHILAFESSYLLLFFVSAAFPWGWVELTTEIAKSPDSLMLMLAVGLGAWIPHFVLLLLVRLVRESNAVSNGVVGGVLFVLGFVVYDLVHRYGPSSISMPLSWVSDYIMIPAYSIFSILGVAFFAMIHKRNRREHKPIIYHLAFFGVLISEMSFWVATSRKWVCRTAYSTILKKSTFLGRIFLCDSLAFCCGYFTMIELLV